MFQKNMQITTGHPIRQHLIFFRYLISYCLVLLVPLILGMFAFFQTSQDLEKRVLEDTHNLLEHRVFLLDQRLQEMDDFTVQLTLDDRINNFLTIKSPLKEGSSVWAVYELQEALAPYRLINNFIDTFHLTFASSQTVITPLYSFVEMKFYYDHYFSYGEMAAGEWFEMLMGSFHQKLVLPSQLVNFGTSQYNAITYIQSLPVNRSATNRGALALFIPEDEFLLHLRSSDADEILICDQDGRILISTFPDDSLQIIDVPSIDVESPPVEFEINGEGNVVFSVVSEYNGWRYYIMSPKQIIGEQLKATHRTLWLILSLAFFLGLFIAYMMAFKRSKPIERLAALLKGQTSSDDPLDLKYIEGSVEQLINRDRELQRIVDFQRPLLQARFLDGLLKGSFDDKRSIEGYRQETGLPPIPDRCVVVVFRWTGLPKDKRDSDHSLLQVRTALVRRTIEWQFGETVKYFYDLDFNNVAVLFASLHAMWDEDILRKGIEESVYTVKMAISESAPEDRLVVGVGTPTISNMDISVSFRAAIDAVEYMPLSDKHPIVWFSNIPKEGSAKYPYKKATQIMNAVKAGNSELVCQLTDEVYTLNFINKTLSAASLHQLKYDIRATLQKLLDWVSTNGEEDDYSAVMSRFDSALTVDEMFDSFSGMLLMIGKGAEKRKRSHNKELCDAISLFIEVNYRDCDLYLPTIAAHFGITKEYLSQFFKEQTGENFSTYLENLRIRKAIKMMEGNGAVIGQIAVSCGYRSPQVFRRAFKRVTGLTPREYKIPGDS